MNSKPLLPILVLMFAGVIPMGRLSCQILSEAPPDCAATQLLSITGIRHPDDNRTALFKNATTAVTCRDLCSANCSCAAAFYQKDSLACYFTALTDGPLTGLQLQANDGNSLAFLKAGPQAQFDISQLGNYNQTEKIIGPDGTKKFIAATAAGIALALAVALTAAYGLAVWRRRITGPDLKSIIVCNKGNRGRRRDSILERAGINLVRVFSVEELEEATNGFSMVLGTGGFGKVYLGKLSSDQGEIAVKKMENWGQGDHEFCTEASVLGAVHHVNLLQLRGFCARDSLRMLVYEYMPNGSLDQWLFHDPDGHRDNYRNYYCNKNNKKDGKFQVTHRGSLTWTTRVQIAVGIARGLAYLHEECRERVLHLDLKPENILLDGRFVAKISDFGFATVLTRQGPGGEDASCMVSVARGTPGYMAPEWLTESCVSSKSDVYSLGMILLEIVGGRRNHEPARERDAAFYPCWAKRKVVEGHVRDVIDPGLADEAVEIEEADTLLRVGLCCIQKSADLRPSMREVVHMLEGVVAAPSSQALASMVHVDPCGSAGGLAGGGGGGGGRSLRSTLMNMTRADIELLASPLG